VKRYLSLLALGAVTACAGSSATGGQPSARPAATEQAAQVDSVRSAYTRADVDFMVGMIHHHAQALVMSRMAPTHGASPRLRTLAARIINAQRDEIRLMQRWLEERGEPVPRPAAAGGDGSGPRGHGTMAGMLSEEQLEALDSARGEEFDRLFLQYMIQHHQGAVTMVNELVATQGAAREEAVFKLASDIGADQSSEITRMQTMLREILFSPGGTP
jgi:uncharacterized protein (DUF305 family)